MTKLAILTLCFLFISILDISSSHLCLFYPQQRGNLPYNIYYPFPLPECARHGDPCGGMPPEKPFRVFEGGKQAYVKWQQNVNIYEVGYPGYMEISIAPLNSTNFEVLAIVQDQNTFGQLARQNYSALIVVPNIDCQHCVLRARYNTHKPGELVYVQCADVTIASTSPSTRLPNSNFPLRKSEYHEFTKGLDLQYNYPIKRHTLQGLILYGFAYNPYETNRLQYVKIDITSGLKEGISRYNFGVGFETRTNSAQAGNQMNINSFQDNYVFVADSVLALNNEKGQTTLLYHDGGNLDEPPNAILELETETGRVIRSPRISNVPKGQAFNALISIADGYITFSVNETKQKGEYVFVVGKLNSSVVYQDLIVTPPIDNTYLNFEWAEFNADDQLLYVLVSKTNVSMYTYYDVPRMYTFNIAKGTFVSFNNLTAQYETFYGKSFHYYKKTGKLYALTAGYFGFYKYADWSLSEIDPSNGNMTQKTYVTSNQVFNPYAGGMIFSGLDQSSGTLYQVLRIADAEADVIAAVNIETQKATFSKLTNLRHIHNLNLLAAV